MLSVHRGNTPIENETELKSHVASLLRLENVGLLLGAGASVSAGGLIMRDLWRKFGKEYDKSLKWLVSEKFVSEEDANVSEESCPVPNIEKLIDDLSITIHEWSRVNIEKLDEARKARADLLRAVVHAAKLSDEIWNPETEIQCGSDSLSDHKVVLQKLISARQPGQSAPWIFTTNYDLAIEWTSESIETAVINGFLGIHNRQFSPHSFDLGFHNTQARGEASFGTYNVYLVKLHGSLSWIKVGDTFFEIQTGDSKKLIDKFLNGDTEKLELLVYPSAAKYSQTFGFIFGELFRKFGEFMSRPQTVLFVVGYGFNDAHINRYLKSALLNPTLQIVIYYPGFDASEDCKTMNYPKDFQQLIDMRSPRLTIVGGKEQAFFNAFAEHLPEPTIFDEEYQKIKKILEDGQHKLISNGKEENPEEK